MQNLRLKAVQFDTDFRFADISTWDAFRRSKKFPGELQPGEAYLFVSRSGNQLMWFLRESSVESAHPNRTGSYERRVIDTRRWRIEGGTWNPQMLQNYANNVGINLQGFRRFEEVYLDDHASA